MKKTHYKSRLTDLTKIRQNGTYSSTNLIRGSMLNEMFTIFSEYLNNNDRKYLMNRVMVDNIVNKNSFYSRENVWRIFDQRYLSCPPWIVHEIAKASTHGKNSPDFISMAYLFYTFRERMAYHIVSDLIWDQWNNKRTVLDPKSIEYSIKSKDKDIPAVKEWSETTIRRCAQSVLSALRDFGLLKGVVNKSIQRPSIILEAAYLLLCILIAEGNEGKGIITAKDWRLFLWSEVDVIDALNRMAMKKWIRFERSGSTTILELVRIPGEKS